MNSARYVGRIGGLAVALGIGAAVAGSPTAWADDPARESAGSSESSEARSLSRNEPSADGGGEAASGTNRGGDHVTSDGAASDDAASDDAASVDGASDDGASDADEDADGDADEVDEGAAGEGGDAPVLEAPGGPVDAVEPVDAAEPNVEADPSVAAEPKVEADPGVADTASGEGRPSRPPADTSSEAVAEGNTVSEREETAEQVDLTAPVSAEAPADEDAPAVEDSAAAPQPEAVLPAPVTTAKSAGGLAHAVGQLWKIADNIIQAVFRPFLTPIPTSPDSSPLLLMLEWWRRTTVGVFYNRAPDASPLQIGEAADGTVVGTVGAIDPDGDPLTYTLAQGPRFGTVKLNADGTYVYTPGTLMVSGGGQDTFTVTVRDKGFRLLSPAAVRTVSVAVTVGAGDALGIGGMPYGVAMSPDRRRAYVTDVDNRRVVVIDVASGSVVDSIRVGAAPYGITVANDGRAYVVNSDDGTLSVIDTATNTVLPRKLYVGNSPTSVAANADGSRVVVTAGNDDAVSIIDTATWTITRVSVGDGAFGVAISQNRAFVTNEFDDTVSVIDLDIAEVITTIAVGNAPTGIAVGGNRLVVTNSGSLRETGDGSVTIIDLDTLTTIGSPVPLGEMPTSVVVDADGRHAYVTDAGYGTVTVIDLTTGAIVGSVMHTVSGATGVDIGFDGRLYVAGSHAGIIDVITPATPAVGAVVPAWEPVTETPVTVAAAHATMMAAATAPVSGARWTRGFDIYNLTTQTVTLIGYEGDARPDGTVALGMPIPPGGMVHFEVPMYFWSSTSVRPIFKGTVTEDTWTVRMNAWVDGFVPTSAISVRHSGGDGTASPSPDDWISTRDDQASLLDARDKTITLDPSDPRSSDLVNKLCNGGGRTTCYAANITKVERGWSAYQLGGTATGSPAVDNNFTSTPREYSSEITATWTSKASFEGSVKLSLSLQKILGADVTAKLGQEFTNSASYKGTVKFTTPAWKKITVMVRMPIVRVTSDLYMTVGNSTVIIRGLTYELPDTVGGMETNTLESDATNPLAVA
ncbi:Ig-like domain-containing protein [Mycobacterium sp. smrl_JER01]|uniref:Ig-like domain-containing protein n=1 Tax=Mycobacterium sp. smrl_JER01 TaxID=3402633 RepID=UPI003AC046D6